MHLVVLQEVNQGLTPFGRHRRYFTLIADQTLIQIDTLFSA